MQKGIIRTPLEPFVTFKDDPLRILRCFRFAGRFQFKLVPEIEEAVKNKEIIQALKHKVSKERVGTEMYGMLKQVNPLKSIGLLKDNHLWSTVFYVPLDSDLKDQ